MTTTSHFSSVNFHLDHGGAVETAATLYGKTRELSAYGLLSIDRLAIFFETAGQAEAVYAELGKIVTHLHNAELAAVWPEDLRGRKVRGVKSAEGQTGTILDRAGVQGDTHAWVLWDEMGGTPSRELLDTLELVAATAELDEV